jgi:NTE family protein
VPQVDLVLEGGGVKGLGLVGAIAVLEEHGYSFAHVAGTSAGAIVGALVAAGMSAHDLHEVLRNVDWIRFRDGDWLDHLGVPGKAISALASQGIYSGEYLTTWLGGLLADHGVVHFADLRTNEADSSLPPHHSYRLVVMTSDVSQGELRRLPWDYPRYGLEPDGVRVVDAVRASMAIPFFYSPVKVDDKITGTESWLVDGGLLSNFPVDVFDRSDGKDARWATLGIKLSARPGSLQGVRNEIAGSASLTRAMLQTMMGSHDQLVLDDPAVLARTISVDTMKVRATDFDITSDTQDQLYENGRKAATSFLATTVSQPASVDTPGAVEAAPPA